MVRLCLVLACLSTEVKCTHGVQSTYAGQTGLSLRTPGPSGYIWPCEQGVKLKECMGICERISLIALYSLYEIDFKSKRYLMRIISALALMHFKKFLKHKILCFSLVNILPRQTIIGHVYNSKH